MPSVSLLRATFSHRRRTLRARLDAAAAARREEAFLRVAPAYRASLDAGTGALRSVADQVDVDGVTWWVPSGDGPPRLPYRGVLETREVATGDRTGTVPFLREGSSGNFHVLRGADAAPAGRAVVEVPCCTLDEWVSRLGIDLDAVTFIKVDVEGFERRVVAGARRVLACRHIAWQMEIKPAGLRGAGDAPVALYEELQQAFTHFIDLNRRAAGRRVREIADLRDAMAYVEPDSKTDVLLFTTGDAAI